MKQYKFTIRGNNYDVEIQNIEDDIATLEVNGTTYEVTIHREKKVSKTPKLVRSQATPNNSSTARTSNPSSAKGTGQLKAPLPGLIMALKVKEGDTVEAGQTVMIMEAMKMENEIKADRAGKVTSIKVSIEQSVLEGDVLMEIGG